MCNVSCGPHRWSFSVVQLVSDSNIEGESEISSAQMGDVAEIWTRISHGYAHVFRKEYVTARVRKRTETEP